MSEHKWMEVETGNQLYANACDQAAFMQLPSTRYRPSLFIDGNQWCALYGENLQDGVAGFGDSPFKAFEAFDRAWMTSLKPKEPPHANP